MKIKLTKQQKKEIAFWALITSGVGLCVGGCFLPVLIPVGVTLLSGAIAIAKDTGPSIEQNFQVNPPPPAVDSRSSSQDDTVGIDLHLDVNRRRRHAHSIHPTEPLVNQVTIDQKEDANHGISINHKHRP